MSSYNRDTRTYESYEMLAKLLNTDKKENIQIVYDTLRQLTEERYKGESAKSEREYAESRDMLARNRAKSEKYLNYFVTEGGYANSGVATDARVKQELNYENNVSALRKSENDAMQELQRIKNEELANIEIQRAQAQIKADDELDDAAYKNEQLALEKEKLQQDNYWQEKQYQLDKEKQQAQLAQNSSSGSSGGSSSSDSSGGSSSGSSSSGSSGNSSGKSDAYYAVMYNDAMKNLAQTARASDVQKLYDSLTGKNTEASEALYGSYYEKLIGQVREKLVKTIDAENNERAVTEICGIMMQFGRTPDDVFLELYNDAATGRASKYTKEQVEEAYRRVSRLYY